MTARIGAMKGSTLGIRTVSVVYFAISVSSTKPMPRTSAPRARTSWILLYIFALTSSCVATAMTGVSGEMRARVPCFSSPAA